ncbi:MAG: 5-formyltetrahydrofolate cyclo-ligase [Trueperaceae bacterium]
MRASEPTGGEPGRGAAPADGGQPPRAGARARDSAPAPAPPSPDAGKGDWRAWARAVRGAWAADHQRRADDEAAMHALLAAWGPWRGAGIALAYVPFGDEPDPIAPWMREARAPALATTRTVGPGEPLQLRAWVEPLERHPFGFLQPRPDAPPVDPGEIDLVLVPGLVFDVHGGRLGHGQGHYDRLLPRLPGHVPLVGVTLDALVVGRLPTEPHDAPVTHLLTPGGIRAADGAG